MNIQKKIQAYKEAFDKIQDVMDALDRESSVWCKANELMNEIEDLLGEAEDRFVEEGREPTWGDRW